MRFLGILLLLAVLTTACHREMLSIRTEEVTCGSLASTRIRTPDPRKDKPYLGQNLIIHWNIPSFLFQEPDIRVVLRVRYGNREEKEIVIPLFARTGSYVESLMNEEYHSKQGIVTYSAEVKAGDKIIGTWKHQLWVDILRIDSPPEK